MFNKSTWLGSRLIITALFVLIFWGNASFAWAKELYVSKTGNDTNLGTPESPFLSIRKGFGQLKPGDTLFISGGVYDEELYYYDNTPSGTAENPITIKPLPGEEVIIKPTKGYCAGKACRVISLANTSYLIFENLIIDASNALYDAVKLDCKFDAALQAIPGSCAHHITFRGGEVMNSFTNCFYVAKESEYNNFIDLKVHTCGIRHPDYPSGHRLFYITGSYNLVEGVEGYDAGAGIGAWVEIGSPNYNVFRNNVVHDIGTNPILTGNKNPGIDMFKGEGNMIYNNIVYNSAGGIRVDYGSKEGKVINNTVYNSNNPTNPLLSGISIGKGTTGTIIKNNIVYGSGEQINNSAGRETTISNNLTIDPKFADAVNYDFRLMPDSPAIDSGEDVSSLGIEKDIKGKKRYQGTAYDIGAFEYVAPKSSTSSGGGGGGGGSVRKKKVSSPAPTSPSPSLGCSSGYLFDPGTGTPCPQSPLPSTSFPPPASSPQSFTSAFGYTTVRLYTKGEGCRAWQRFFNEKLGTQLKTDGVCGPITIYVAKKWQTHVGLKADGALGALSRAKALMQN